MWPRISTDILNSFQNVTLVYFSWFLSSKQKGLNNRQLQLSYSSRRQIFMKQTGIVHSWCESRWSQKESSGFLWLSLLYLLSTPLGSALGKIGLQNPPPIRKENAMGIHSRLIHSCKLYNNSFHMSSNNSVCYNERCIRYRIMVESNGPQTVWLSLRNLLRLVCIHNYVPGACRSWKSLSGYFYSISLSSPVLFWDVV